MSEAIKLEGETSVVQRPFTEGAIGGKNAL